MEWIEKCLSNLFTSTFPIQVIVVDNHSSDDTVAFIEKKFSEVHIVKNNDNLGFGAANNLALREYYSRGYDYFFLLNQDAYVEASCIGALVNSMSENPRYGIMSPIHMNGAGNALDHSFARYMRKEFSRKFLTDYCDDSLSKGIYGAPFVNAAAWMITRDCLKKVGVFHPLFYHYGEDDNFGSRVRKEGFKIGILSSTKIYHHREQRAHNPFKDDPRIMFEWKTKINVLYPKSNGQKVSRFFLIFWDIVSISFKHSIQDFFPFWLFALRFWRIFNNEVKSFDNNQLKIN